MNVQDLFDRASQIRDEREVGANSAERVGGLMFDMLNYSVENRRALNGDKDYVDANSYPYMAVYIESSDDWKELNDRLSDIDSIATTKFNGNIRYYLSGVRVDVQNRTLHYANKYTSQVAVGPLQVIGGKLAQATTADKTYRRIYNGSWSAWEEVACVGRAGSAIGAEIYNSYTGESANEATGIYAHAEGFNTKAQGVSSHAEGDSNTALGAMSHAEGIANFVSSRGGHVEGSDNRINSADGATGRDSGHAHAEGYNNEIGPYAPQAHVEGSTNFAGSKNAHVEGFQNRLENGSRNSHAEGENNNIKAGAHVSHAEGGDNTNNGAAYAHVEGKSNVANNGATGGHIEGLNNTINNEAEHAAGHWNLSTPGKTHYSVGIGSASDRKNAYEIDKQGNIYMVGVNGYDGRNASGSNSLQNMLNQDHVIEVPKENLNLTYTRQNGRWLPFTYYIDAELGGFTAKKDPTELEKVFGSATDFQSIINQNIRFLEFSRAYDIGGQLIQGFFFVELNYIDNQNYTLRWQVGDYMFIVKAGIYSDRWIFQDILKIKLSALCENENFHIQIIRNYSDAIVVQLNKRLPKDYHIVFFRRRRVRHAGVYGKKYGVRYCLQCNSEEGRASFTRGFRPYNDPIDEGRWIGDVKEGRYSFLHRTEHTSYSWFDIAKCYTEWSESYTSLLVSTTQRTTRLEKFDPSENNKMRCTINFGVAVVKLCGRSITSDYIICSNIAKVDFQFWNHHAGFPIDLEDYNEISNLGFGVRVRN